jgi:hypothetical protein
MKHRARQVYLQPLPFGLQPSQRVYWSGRDQDYGASGVVIRCAGKWEVDVPEPNMVLALFKGTETTLSSK